MPTMPAILATWETRDGGTVRKMEDGTYRFSHPDGRTAVTTRPDVADRWVSHKSAKMVSPGRFDDGTVCL